jgi:hypothetical protein
MKHSGKRASARGGEVCPKGNEFDRLAAAIDAAEGVAWDRIGGPTEAECGAIRRLEAMLPTPSTASNWRWLAVRLARGLANDWRAEDAIALLKLAT